MIVSTRNAIDVLILLFSLFLEIRFWASIALVASSLLSVYHFKMNVSDAGRESIFPELYPSRYLGWASGTLDRCNALHRLWLAKDGALPLQEIKL